MIRAALGKDPISDADEQLIPTLSPGNRSKPPTDLPDDVDTETEVASSYVDSIWPPGEKRELSPPIKSEHANKIESWEEMSEQFDPRALVSCPHCNRTFLPERLEIHLRSCKADRPLKKRGVEPKGANLMPLQRSGANAETTDKKIPAKRS